MKHTIKPNSLLFSQLLELKRVNNVSDAKISRFLRLVSCGGDAPQNMRNFGDKNDLLSHIFNIISFLPVNIESLYKQRINEMFVVM